MAGMALAGRPTAELLIALFQRAGGPSVWLIDVASGTATQVGRWLGIPAWQRLAP
jgi:hypothetical protein